MTTTAADATRKNLPGLGSIYLRGKTWHCEFWKNNRQYRESTKTANDKKAVAFLKARVLALNEDKYVGPKSARLSVSDLLDLVAQDYTARGNRSTKTLTFRVAPLKAELGHLRAAQVQGSTVEMYKTRRLAQDVSRGTINRELAALRRGYRLATSPKHRHLAPSQMPVIELFPEASAREGFVDYDDFTALLSHLPSPVDDVIRFAYHAGWRRGEIITLTWADVDRARGLVRLRPEFSKSKKHRELPITGTIREVIERRWQARLINGKGDSPRISDLVFHRAGEAVLDFRGAWTKAVTAIGRPNLLVHDLRRSAVRNMMQAGVSEKVAMTVTGHKTRSVFDRYHIVDSRDVQSALERTEASLRPDPRKQATFPAQAPATVNRNGHRD